MANKRNLKKKINEICSILYVRCSALENRDENTQMTELKGVITGILFLQDKMLTLCNKAPRKDGRSYFPRHLKDFKEKITELSDQLDTL